MDGNALHLKLNFKVFYFINSFNLRDPPTQACCLCFLFSVEISEKKIPHLISVCNVVNLFSDHGTLFFCCMGTFFCFFLRYYVTIEKVWKQFKELMYQKNKLFELQNHDISQSACTVENQLSIHGQDNKTKCRFRKKR